MPDNILKATISVTAPGVQQTFAQVAAGAKQAETGLKDLGTGVTKTQAVVRQLPPVITDTTLTLRDQRTILASLQKQFAALSTQQAKSRIGLELAADIKIANAEIKRLEAGAVSSFGNVGKAATKGFSALRQLAFILPGLGIAGIFNLAFTAIEGVVSSLFRLNSGFSSAALEAAQFKQALDDISKSAENLKSKLDFQDDISRLKAQLSGLSGTELDIFDIANRTKSATQIITSEEIIIRKLSKQRNAVEQVSKAYIEAGFASQKFTQLAAAAAAGQVIPKTLISQLPKTEQGLADSYISILKEIEDAQKRSSAAQSAIGKNFLQTQIDQAQAQKDLLKKRSTDWEQFINQTISEGKRLAAEFGNLSRINLSILPTFSEVDTKSEQLKKAQQIIRDVNAFFKDFSSKNRALRLVIPIKPEPLVLPLEQTIITRTQAQITDILKGIVDTNTLTIAPNIKIDPNVTFDFSLDAAKQVSDAGQQFGDDFGQAFRDEVQKNIAKGLDFRSAIDASIQRIGAIKAAIESVQAAFASIQVDSLANIGTAIGTALAGGDLKNVFANFANIIGEGLETIGKQMIRIGVVAVLAKKALAKLFANPALTIVAGIALVAAGAALKKLLGGGIRGFAKGGRPPVGKDVLVGEKGPEIFRADRPGVIIPNHKIKEYSKTAISSVAIPAQRLQVLAGDKGDKLFTSFASTTHAKELITNISKVVASVFEKVAELHSSIIQKIFNQSRDVSRTDTATDSKLVQSSVITSLSKDVSTLLSKVFVSTDSSHSSISTKDISKILSEAIIFSHSSSAQKELVSKYNVSDVAKILSTVFTSTSTHDRDSSKVNTFDKVIHSAFQYSTSATDKLIDRLATYTEKSSKSSDSKASSSFGYSEVFQSLISSTDKSGKEFSELLSNYTTASKSSELFSEVSRSVKELYSLFTNYSDSKLLSSADKSTTATESRFAGSTLVTDKLLSTYSDLAAYYSDSKLVSTQTTATFKSILSTLREFSDIAGSVIKTTSAINTASVATATNTTKESTATTTRESSHSSATDRKTSIRESIISFIQSSKQIFHSVNNTIERLLSTVIKTQSLQPAVVQSQITNITRAASTLNNLTRNVQFRAAGGPVSRNAPTIVGEKGPELFTPKVSGYIIPHHKVNSYLKNLYKTSIAEKEINLFRSTRNIKDLNLSKIFNRRISNFSQLTHKELSTIIGKQFAGFRAGGGFVAAGNSFVVGEKQIELFVPNTGASIITNNNNTGGVGRVLGGTLKVEGNIRIAGSDLIAVISNASRSQSRLS